MRVAGGGSLAQELRVKAGSTLDRAPFRRRPHSPTPTHPLNSDWPTHLTAHLWDVGENPPKHGKNSTQTVVPARSQFFSHQCYNKRILNKTTLFKDPLFNFLECYPNHELLNKASKIFKIYSVEF